MKLTKVSNIIVSALMLASVVWWIIIMHKKHNSKVDRLISNRLLMDTPSCQIPDLDPYDSSIASLIWRYKKIKCSHKGSITYGDGDVLHINWTVVNTVYKGNLKYCKYRPILRTKQSDSQFEYGPFSRPFKRDIEVNEQFLKVECISRSNERIYTNFHAFVLSSKQVEKRCNRNLKRHLDINEPREIMNVLMIGLDAVSRLNFMRQMPLTRQYLLKDLGAIEMLGYNKVADQTLLNIVPLLTGKFLHELPMNYSMNNKPFDSYDFIWKTFSKGGYRTLNAEDHPDIAAFNYLKEGFHTPPTDHYIRPFSLAMERELSVWDDNRRCVSDRLEMDILLKYTRDFAKLYKQKPHFGFTFSTRITHDDPNMAGGADDPLVRLLKQMKINNLLENTVLIVFSDHGMRYGKMRTTFVGRLEDRMPLMSIVLPKWFKTKYPKLFENISTNSKRLTTAFDVYETLLDVLNFKGQMKMANGSVRGISLFSEIPRDRSCDKAAISPHWCICVESQYKAVNFEQANIAAEFIVKNVNSQLSPYSHLCEKLQVREIREVEQMIQSRQSRDPFEGINGNFYGKWRDDVIFLRILLVAHPGSGLLEATVKLSGLRTEMSLAGDVSRLNVYGHQIKCIDNFHLEKFCFCK